MFDGKEFCVVNGPKALPKEEIEKKIAEVSIYTVCGSLNYRHYITVIIVKSCRGLNLNDEMLVVQDTEINCIRYT